MHSLIYNASTGRKKVHFYYVYQSLSLSCLEMNVENNQFSLNPKPLSKNVYRTIKSNLTERMQLLTFKIIIIIQDKCKDTDQKKFKENMQI